MPSPMLATAIADPAYKSALKAAGFTAANTVTYGGRTYTHDEIAAMVDESYQRHRGEFCFQVGGKPRVARRQQRQFRAAVQSDVRTSFGISGWTVGFAILLGILGGPMGLVIAIVTVLFEYYLTKDLDGDPKMLTAMGAA